MNIFEIIENVTKRTEPFHSEFLTESLRTDMELRKKFFDLVLPADLIPSFSKSSFQNKLVIESEDRFENRKRIDVIIQDKDSKKIIGIEVKTSDSSVSANQLSDYSKNMREKYPDYQIIMVFLTPFNTDNLPEDILPSKINAIQEFLKFEEAGILSVHINWRDIVNLYKKPVGLQNSLYSQHEVYICKRVINESLLRIDNIERNREFFQFFGQDTFEKFIEYVKNEKLFFREEDKKYLFPLEENRYEFKKIISLIKIVIESEQLNKTTSKKNFVTNDLLYGYCNGTYGKFFRSLFSTVEKFPFIWLEGKKRIGVRASHPSHPNGVSILTVSTEAIEILKKR